MSDLKDLVITRNRHTGPDLNVLGNEQSNSIAHVWSKNHGGHEGHEGIAHRIVTCVNACAGVSTEVLESGILQDMVEALKKLDFLARTSGGWLPDADLKAACDEAEEVLIRLSILDSPQPVAWPVAEPTLSESQKAAIKILESFRNKYVWVERAIHNVKWHSIYKIGEIQNNLTSLPQAVDTFIWEDTEEGFEAWRNASHSILTMDKGPVPEEPELSPEQTKAIGILTPWMNQYPWVKEAIENIKKHCDWVFEQDGDITSVSGAIDSFNWRVTDQGRDYWNDISNHICDETAAQEKQIDEPVLQTTSTVAFDTVIAEGRVVSSVVKIAPANFDLSVLDIPSSMFNAEVDGKESLLTFGGKEISINQLTAIALTAFCPSEEESLRVIENYLEKK